MKTAFRQKTKNRSKGFTLFEVMISVAIIAIIFLSLFRLQAGTIDLATTGKFNTLAPILANDLLSKIERNISEWSDTQGDFGDEYPGFSWSCSFFDVFSHLEDNINEDNQNKLKKIELNITGPDKKSYKIVTLRHTSE